MTLDLRGVAKLREVELNEFSERYPKAAAWLERKAKMAELRELSIARAGRRALSRAEHERLEDLSRELGVRNVV